MLTVCVGEKCVKYNVQTVFVEVRVCACEQVHVHALVCGLVNEDERAQNVTKITPRIGNN